MIKLLLFLGIILSIVKANGMVYSTDACFGFLLGDEFCLLAHLFVCSWCRRRSRKRDEEANSRRGGRTV